MANSTHKTYGTIISGLTTELNSITNAANTAASAAIDNSAALDLFGDVELVLATQGSARTAGALIAVYILPSADGTNYPDTHETTAELWCTFALDASVTARRAVVRDCPLPPGLFKIFARNLSTQTLAASGSTIKIRPHSIQTV